MTVKDIVKFFDPCSYVYHNRQLTFILKYSGHKTIIFRADVIGHDEFYPYTNALYHAVADVEIQESGNFILPTASLPNNPAPEIMMYVKGRIDEAKWKQIYRLIKLSSKERGTYGI